MLSNYVNQNLTRKARSETRNDYNEYTYTTSTVKGRFIYKRELFRLDTGEEVLSDGICYTMATFKEGDLLTADGKDWVVRRVYPAVKLNGVQGFTKVVL